MTCTSLQPAIESPDEKEGGKEFLQKDDFNLTAWMWLSVQVIGLLGIVATIATLIVRWETISRWLKP
jgi:hypothetical protein